MKCPSSKTCFPFHRDDEGRRAKPALLGRRVLYYKIDKGALKPGKSSVLSPRPGKVEAVDETPSQPYCTFPVLMKSLSFFRIIYGIAKTQCRWNPRGAGDPGVDPMIFTLQVDKRSS